MSHEWTRTTPAISPAHSTPRDALPIAGSPPDGDASYRLHNSSADPKRGFRHGNESVVVVFERQNGTSTISPTLPVVNRADSPSPGRRRVVSPVITNEWNVRWP